MPIYKGNTPVNNLYYGNQSISNVYIGSTPVFSSVEYPYKVRITGPLNQTESSATGNTVPLPYSGFRVNASQNVGAIWYGVALNGPAFGVMEDIAPHDGTVSTILKTAWYDFISLYIGYDLFNTDMNAFTINNIFYALNMTEWSQSTYQPVDPTNTHAWKFISNNDYFDISYVTLDATDFATIQGWLVSGAELVQFIMCPMGMYVNGLFDVDIGGLLVSQIVSFYLTYTDPIVEYLTNNDQQVSSNLVQSLTNNFNFNVRSMLLGCLSEVMRVGWNFSGVDTSKIQILTITNYTPPTTGVTGALTTEYVSLNDLMGGN